MSYLSDFDFCCNHTGVHYNGVPGLPADHDRYVYSRRQEQRGKTDGQHEYHVSESTMLP